MKTLFSVAIAITAFACSKNKNANLENSWELESYVQNRGALVTNILFTNYTLIIYDDSLYTIQMDKNSFNGAFTIVSKKINFHLPLTFTELCCDSTVSTEAKNLLIDSVSVYEINDNSLKLSGAHGTFLKFSLKN